MNSQSLIRREDLLDLGRPGPRAAGDLVFHVTSWHAADFDADNDSDDEDQAPVMNEFAARRRELQRSRFTVTAFGVTDDGRSVGLTLREFTPFFFVKVPESLAPRLIHKHLVDLAGWRLHEARLFQKRDFWGYTARREFSFVRLSFKSLSAMRWTAARLRDKQCVRGAGQVLLQAYEANIDPLLRLFHIRDLKPAGWLRVRASALEAGSGPRTHCMVDATCHWTSIAAEEREDVAPLLMAAFDIECNSAHGDFPVARKDYRRLALDLEQAWAAIKTRSEYDVKVALIAGMHASFGLLDEAEARCMSMARLQLKRPLSSDQDRAAVVAAIKRVVDDVFAVLKSPGGAASARVAAGPDEDDDEEEQDNSTVGRLVCVLNAAFNRRWPLQGDSVIQIGTTVSRYGDASCCARIVYTLHSCDEIPGARVVAFEDEGQMLVAWARLVRELDPDVMLGYNVLGFDMAYLHDRAQDLLGKHGTTASFGKLGRVRDLESPFVQQKLSSSAMGDNVMHYFDMQGRVTVDLMKVVQRAYKLDSYKLDSVAAHFMGLNKHDVGPNDIFRLQRGTSADRRVIAEYCLQDCELCNNLQAKLDIVPNNMGMANVCSVPLSFIFMRGQGVKIFSLVAKQCRADGYLIPTRAFDRKANDDGEDAADSYEGAIVLEPETGMYLDDPVSVLDYNSLYPSSMISENISHDTLVLDQRYASLEGTTYVDVEYDVYEGKGDDKRKVGTEVCRFAQDAEGVLPRILKKLLAARKVTRQRIEHVKLARANGQVHVGAYDATTRTLDTGSERLPLSEEEVPLLEPAYDTFQRAVLDGLQQAYKVTANSLYGQMGARTSQLYLKQVAACTTAVGRMMIQKAKDYVESVGGHVVYGDTDSIFVVFKNVGEDGGKLRGRDALLSSIRQGQSASRGIKPSLKAPHNLEYEKTLFPLILLSKKRYVGLLYEDDPDSKPKMKSMGIALKRRDYAPIVKKIYGGIIDIILRERDIPAAVDYLSKQLADLADGRYDLADLIISKTLRSYYKVPHQIAHWVLARRMKERDPGSAPQANDRIPYVFVETSKKNALMGDRIEHVEHVRKNGETQKVDTKTYIVNQIQKPCLQLLAIGLESIPGYVVRPELSAQALAQLVKDKKGNVRKAQERMDTLREREVERLIFAPVLARPVFRQRDNRCARQKEITSYFSRAGT
jgi:DNA polymerase elongation subunit (family B)